MKTASGFAWLQQDAHMRPDFVYGHMQASDIPVLQVFRTGNFWGPTAEEKNLKGYRRRGTLPYMHAVIASRRPNA